MKIKNVVNIISATLTLCLVACTIQAQTIWFGTVKSNGKVIQGRFIIDSLRIPGVYAPYGITPVAFKEVKQQDKQLTFSWEINHFIYHCTLLKQDWAAYKGTCTCKNAVPVEVAIREFTEDDARMQGNMLQADSTDLQILDRALMLLNNGKNWNRSDDRICDNSSYPYKWSLFCALHQASVDVDGEYRHLRPSIQAARQAIDEVTAGKKFAHLLQDFNNEALSFNSIEGVLNRAKEIIGERIRRNEKKE